MKRLATAVCVTALVLGACKKSEENADKDKQPDPANKVTAVPPDKPAAAAWSSQQTAKLVLDCHKAMAAIDKAAMKRCYSDSFVSKVADETLAFPDGVGSAFQIEDAEMYKALFDAQFESQIVIATPTRAVQVLVMNGALSDKHHPEKVRGKKVHQVLARVSRLTDKGKLESELVFLDQAAQGNQNEQWPNPWPAGEFPTLNPAVVVSSTGDATEKANLDVVRKLHAAGEADNIDESVKLFAEPSKGWEPMGDFAFATRADRKKSLEKQRTRKKDLSVKVVDEFAAGAWVVQLLRSRAVEPDGKKVGKYDVSGKTVEHSVLKLYRLEGGLIHEVYNFYNPLSVQAQLGIFDPAPAIKKIQEARAKKKAADGAAAKDKSAK